MAVSNTEMTILRTPSRMFDFKKGKEFYPPLGRSLSYRDMWLENMKAKAHAIQKPFDEFLAHTIIIPHLVAYYHHQSRKEAIERGDLEFSPPEGETYTYDDLLKSCKKATNFLKGKVSASLFARVEKEAKFEFQCQIIDFFLREDNHPTSGGWKVDLEDKEAVNKITQLLRDVITKNSPDIVFDDFEQKVLHTIKTNQDKFLLDSIEEEE